MKYNWNIISDMNNPVTVSEMIADKANVLHEILYKDALNKFITDKFSYSYTTYSYEYIENNKYNIISYTTYNKTIKNFTNVWSYNTYLCDNYISDVIPETSYTKEKEMEFTEWTFIENVPSTNFFFDPSYVTAKHKIRPFKYLENTKEFWLKPYWNNEYILSFSKFNDYLINEEDLSNYEITHYDYINGKITLEDKLSSKKVKINFNNLKTNEYQINSNVLKYVK